MSHCAGGGAAWSGMGALVLPVKRSPLRLPVVGHPTALGKCQDQRCE
jgi:hypothetical protein